MTDTQRPPQRGRPSLRTDARRASTASLGQRDDVAGLRFVGEFDDDCLKRLDPLPEAGFGGFELLDARMGVGELLLQGRDVGWDRSALARWFGLADQVGVVLDGDAAGRHQ
jgi:hypothetical protein